MIFVKKNLERNIINLFKITRKFVNSDFNVQNKHYFLFIIKSKSYERKTKDFFFFCKEKITI